MLGEAGVGKSRLTHELIGHVETLLPPVTVRRGRCLAYGGVSYSALADAVKAECGILEDDPPEVVSDKVARTVERLLGDRSAALHVEALVGAGTGAVFSREELFSVWRRLLERIAANAPLLLALEDLHWADEGLLDFVDHLTDWAEAPLLVLTLARPELLDRRPSWGGGKRNATSLTLEPLTPTETETLVRELLSAPPPVELVRVLVERGEGNPLFGEEILRMLIDLGVLRATTAGGWELVSDPAEVAVPRSIRAVIGARLDALPDEEKDVLQAAAVVGRVFWVGAVQRLAVRGRRETHELLRRLRSRDVVVAAELLLDGVRRQAGRTEIWGSVNLLAESVRRLAALDDSTTLASPDCSSPPSPHGASPRRPSSPGPTGCSSRSQAGRLPSSARRRPRSSASDAGSSSVVVSSTWHRPRPGWGVTQARHSRGRARFSTVAGRRSSLPRSRRSRPTPRVGPA